MANEVLSRTDLINVVQDNFAKVSKNKINKSDTEIIVKEFLDVIRNTLVEGNEVSLIGFGSFSVLKRKARLGRNPQTGKEIKIAAKNSIKFKPGKNLKDSVN